MQFKTNYQGHKVHKEERIKETQIKWAIKGKIQIKGDLIFKGVVSTRIPWCSVYFLTDILVLFTYKRQQPQETTYIPACVVWFNVIPQNCHCEQCTTAFPLTGRKGPFFFWKILWWKKWRPTPINVLFSDLINSCITVSRPSYWWLSLKRCLSHYSNELYNYLRPLREEWRPLRHRDWLFISFA